MSELWRAGNPPSRLNLEKVKTLTFPKAWAQAVASNGAMKSVPPTMHRFWRTGGRWIPGGQHHNLAGISDQPCQKCVFIGSPVDGDDDLSVFTAGTSACSPLAVERCHFTQSGR